ncbi:AbfB domain-containing protein [Streptomyces sp. NPDC001348]
MTARPRHGHGGSRRRERLLPRDASGKYLRHHGFRGRSGANDGTSAFAVDATFIARTGTAGGSARFEAGPHGPATRPGVAVVVISGEPLPGPGQLTGMSAYPFFLRVLSQAISGLPLDGLVWGWR